MTGSAIFGQPPSNSDDYWTIKGLMRLYQIPEGVINPANGFPAQLHAPPDYRFETQGPVMLAGICVALVVVLLITGTRLGLRAGRKDLRWGLDDWVIIPAAVGGLILTERWCIEPTKALV